MKRLTPEQRNQLAGEYVLGTLHGLARRRFERLIRDDRGLAAAVQAWERYFSILDRRAVPVRPPKRVWRAIEARIAGHRRPSIDTGRAPGFWRGLAIGSSLAAIALAVALALFVPREVPLAPDYVAVINDEQAQPVWLVQVDSRARRVALTPLRSPPAQPGKDYELWLLPAGDAPPISMGLLPSEARAMRVFAQSDLIATAKGLAVSVEPTGGSPTGLPTGPVVFQAPLTKAL